LAISPDRSSRYGRSSEKRRASSISASLRNRTLFWSITSARLIRRPPDSAMPRQFWKDSLISL